MKIILNSFFNIAVICSSNTECSEIDSTKPFCVNPGELGSVCGTYNFAHNFLNSLNDTVIVITKKIHLAYFNVAVTCRENVDCAANEVCSNPGQITSDCRTYICVARLRNFNTVKK